MRNLETRNSKLETQIKQAVSMAKLYATDHAQAIIDKVQSDPESKFLGRSVIY